MQTYEIRFQTGEIADVAEKIKQGEIPKLDVDDYQELEWCLEKLSTFGLTESKSILRDNDAIDKNKYIDFEFRIAFDIIENGKIGYLDVYFEPIFDEEYDPIGEM